MFLTKDKDGDLCVVNNACIEWYTDHKIIKVVNGLPKQIRNSLHVKSNKLSDIKEKQYELLNRAMNEVRLRKKVIKEINKLTTDV